MHKITEESISEDIFNSLIPQKTVERSRLLKKINEAYQYNIKTYNQINSGDYSVLQSFLKLHELNY
jgi:hypothetical protein